jgi:hypothetical protein
MNTNGGQAAVDRAKIVAVVNSIARAADRRDWTALERAFGPEATLDNGTTEKLTPAETVARRRPLISSLDATHNILREHRVDVRGGTARCETEFLGTLFLKGAAHGEIWTLCAHYTYELSKLRGDWRVLAMKLAPGESSGNRGHLRRGQAARRHGCPGVWLGGCR